MSSYPQQIYQQAVMAMRANKPDQAAVLLKGLVKKGAVNEGVFQLFCQALLSLNKEKELQKTIKVWQKFDAKSPGIPLVKALLHKKMERYELAASEFERSFKLNRSNPQALLEVCLMYQNIEEWPQAEKYIDQYLDNGGMPLEGYTRKAICRYSVHDYVSAQEYLNKAKEQGGEHDVLRYYQAMIDDKTGKKQQAEKEFLALIAKGHESSRFSLSLLYFSIGEWQKAFDYYDARPIARGFRSQCEQLNQVFWQGEDLSGKKLFIRKEQGLGDQIQSQIFFHSLVQESIDITLFVDSRLHPIVKANFPMVRCVGSEKEAERLLKSESFDYCLCMGSLGRRYSEIFETNELDKTHGFLSAPQDLIEGYSAELKDQCQDASKPLVGLCWRSVKYMKGRDDWLMTAQEMAQCLEGVDAYFVSLQHDVVPEEEKAFMDAGIELIKIEDLNLKDDQLALLALIKSLNYVVTVTNAMCQIAGASGVKTHCLSIKDIRWLVSEPHMKGYYPSVKMYYKAFGENWDETIKAVNVSLIAENGC